MEIILALDSYDDIFDDFDMQGYIERALSADFVNVLNSRIKKTDLKEKIGVIFTIPKNRRDDKTEELITKRLTGHFVNMARYWEEKEKETSSFAMFLVALGLIFFIVGQLLIHQFAPFFDEYLIIPAWILTFYGLDKMLSDKPKASSKRQFYDAISKAKLTFRDQDIYSR
jgi:hypothetical protein